MTEPLKIESVDHPDYSDEYWEKVRVDYYLHRRTADIELMKKDLIAPCYLLCGVCGEEIAAGHVSDLDGTRLYCLRCRINFS